MPRGCSECANGCAGDSCATWSSLGQHLEGHGEIEHAMRLYERGLELDNLSEELYRRLMLIYQQLGRAAGALEVYRRCRHLLSVVLGVVPSAETEAIYRSLKAA